MTLIRSDESTTRGQHDNYPAPSTIYLAGVAEKKPLPRFILKKRTYCSSNPEPATLLATVNSAFLSGLFADVANVQVSSSSRSQDAEDSRADCASPFKKMRLSKTMSMTRCGKSFKSLQEAAVTDEDLLRSPSGAADFFGVMPTSAFDRHDSLQFQLTCVSSSSHTQVDAASPRTVVMDAGRIAFPLLPTTVSESTCKLTRIISDLQTFESDNTTQSKECYGWFVEMDNDNEHFPAANPYYASEHATASSNLAFLAATAPKAASYDAEVEWAKAADTVDDVLGDFF